ncbi:hypothetical protein AgCh_016572 [Apium graveolens]
MERKSLLVFKQGVISGTQRQDLLLSWKNEEEECCKWKGVSCDDLTGHVTHLDISYPATPPYMFRSDVSISHSLLNLSYLKYLDLSGTFFGELTVPKFIGSLTRLVHLDLSRTYIKGPIPNQFGKLANLQYLSLSQNSFYGPVPKFIGSLNHLIYLDLSSNRFSGVIPQELENLLKLQHLDLGNNFLTSSDNFEWLFNLHALVHLDFSYVSIPHPSVWVSFIQRIPNISVLQLNYCNLSAPSSTLSNFSTSLSALHLQGNHINSSIFYWLSHLNGSLQVLDLSYNALVGRIPLSFGGHMTAITHLNLDHNLLTGPIPLTFSLMTALTYLDLSANQLNGVLPKSFSKLSSLRVADFSSNNLTGNLEDILLGPLAFLQELSISKNQLTGSLPDITLLSSLKKLKAGSNKLNGYLPIVF